MERLHETLLRSHTAETIAITLSGGAPALAAFDIITPILGFIGAALGVAAGIYSIRLKRAQWKRYVAENALE